MSYQNRSPKNLRYGIERLMCNLVCEGKIDIASAQQAFATDWIAAYQKYFGGRKRAVEEPIPSQKPPSPPDPACPIKGNVNAKGERIYHKPVTETMTALS